MESKLLALLLVLLPASAAVTTSTSCGGCYQDDYKVSPIEVSPDPGCVVASSGEIDPCDGVFALSIYNACPSVLMIENTAVAPGESFSQQSSGAGMLSGSYQGSPLVISWTTTPID